MNNSLGIIGGVGPLASAYFYEMITNMTKASKDQDHLNIIIFSHSTIPDRTEYILGKSSQNPYPLILEDCKKLANLGCKMIFIPCNTSCYFHDDLQKNIDIPVNNMIEDTVMYLKDNHLKKVMILATAGTIKSRLYQNMCEKYGIEYVEPTELELDSIMDIIYNNVKSGKEVDINKWNSIVDNKDVDGFILGCTELSVVKRDLKLGEKFIDPLKVEAEKIIKYFKKDVKEC